MKNILIVFGGGGVGSIVRYLLGRWVAGHNGVWPFPLGTFIVNITACLILGIVIGFADEKQVLSPSVKLFLTVGFCGGFSTFSTFSAETLGLIQKGEFMIVSAYILTSVFICLAATFAGVWAVRQFA